LGVSYIGAERHGHVAGRAVRLFLVVFSGELFAVARDAFGAVVGGAILWRDGLVRVVAGGAGKGVARFFLAAAFGEGFELASGAESGRNVAGEDVVADVGREIIAGAKFVDVLSGAFDGGVAFEMTLHANLIAECG